MKQLVGQELFVLMRNNTITLTSYSYELISNPINKRQRAFLILFIVLRTVWRGPPRRDGSLVKDNFSVTRPY